MLAMELRNHLERGLVFWRPGQGFSALRIAGKAALGVGSAAGHAGLCCMALGTDIVGWYAISSPATK